MVSIVMCRLFLHGNLGGSPELVKSVLRCTPVHQPSEVAAVHEKPFVDLALRESLGGKVIGDLGAHPIVFSNCNGKRKLVIVIS